MPQGQGRVDQATGDAMLAKAPDLAPFIKAAPAQDATPSHLMGLDNQLHPAQRVTPAMPAGYNITRPESDAYSRALMASQDKLADREARERMAQLRLAQGANATRIRAQIAGMQDQTKREIAQAQLDALIKYRSAALGLRADSNDLEWAEADANVLNDWQRLISNPLNLMPDGMVAPRPPSGRRGGGRGTGTGTKPPADPVDDILSQMGFGPSK